MAVIISSKNIEKKFGNNKIITIGSSQDSDFFLNYQNFELILEYNDADNTYILINNTNSVPLYKGEIFSKITITSVLKLFFPNSDEYINIKVLAEDKQKEKKLSSNFIFSNTGQISATQLEEIKNKIEFERAEIINQISHKIQSLNKKISQNTKGIVFSHISLALSSFIPAFAVTNYIMGLSIQDSTDYIHLPTDLKLWLLFTVLILTIMLTFKQGMYIFFNSTMNKISNNIAETILLTLSSILIIGIYAINLIYYLDYTNNVIFSILISLFFISFPIVIATLAGYCKSKSYILVEQLNKIEYSMGFEKIIHEYNRWIGYFVNNLSSAKLRYIEERKFKLKIKETIEIIIGLITAPFLAYGVSNTLATCFPEAANWIRISGLRFSPIFLILASFLIIFAFFLFIHSFFLMKKISNSEIIKHDGFSNYLCHCVEILGFEATQKINNERKFSLYGAIAIIFIEFSMNISYFSNEIGQDFYGLFLSFIAALVPTALLLAETFLVSGTKFEIYALEEINAKADR